MGKKLYVGNLPFSVTDEALQQIFSQIGTVESVTIITDRNTGRTKGFAFVEMVNEEDAAAAISKFNGTDYQGRALTVAEARPQAPRESRGFQGGHGGKRGNSGGSNSRNRW
jgi:RNA recognition motif-containing protein